MSSRYYNNQYYNAPPYTSPYRGRQYAQKAPPKPKPRPGVIRDSGHLPGPYSPTLGRKRPIGHWKPRKKAKDKDDEEKTTKFGEFNQEAIEAELNKYKKGVFYHDDEPSINGHNTKPQTQRDRERYAQYQLTRTQQAAPKVYEDLPRAVPPNYAERIKSTDHLNDDSKSDEKKQKLRKDKKLIQDRDKQRKKARVRKKRTEREQDRGIVNLSPHHGGYPPPPARYGGVPPDYYYYGAGAPEYDLYSGVAPAPPSYGSYPYGYNGDYTYSNIGPYGGYPAYPRTDRGVVQDDGSWYPYPDMLQQQGVVASIDPFATPKQTRRNNVKIDSANVDLTTPLTEDQNKRMSPGRRVNKIQKQLEYYFSPQNMSNDEFLRDSMDKNGWVDVEIIVAFNRMKVLGATKDLVSEAAWHSTTIEIDSKNPDKIRMTKLWKQYVTERNKERAKDKDKDRERRKKKYVSSKQREKELDAAELNAQTIEYIVQGIERKHEKRKKKRQQREKQKEKDKDNDKDEESKEKEEKEDETKENENEKEKDKGKEEDNKEMEQKDIEQEEDDDMVEVD